MTPGRSATVPSRGDVILVPFPLAELRAHKARPAVVVSGQEFFRAEGKIVVAAITSNVRAHAGPTNLQLARWRECGLLKPSVVTSWLATLAPDLILMRIGALKTGQLRAVESRLRATLEL
jgi:mRNA-degrading endonuclease toxin of MazEF toxin-antitoxin module